MRHPLRHPAWRAKHSGFILLVAVVVALSLPAVSFGQSSVSGYSTPAGEVQADVSSSPNGTPNTPTQAAKTTAAQGGQNLPFTGLDVALLFGVGVVLLGMGFVLQRAAKGSPAE